MHAWGRSARKTPEGGFAIIKPFSVGAKRNKMTDQQAAENYGAQMYLPKGDDPDVAMLFYRWHTVILNTGEFRTNLQYLSFCNLWQNSFTKEQKKLLKKLKQIDGVPEHDIAAAEKAIAEKELKLWGAAEYERMSRIRSLNRKIEDQKKTNGHQKR